MKKRRYLTIQIMAIIIALSAGAIFVCWLVNSIFLEKYYVLQKQQTMIDDFETMTNANAAGMLEDDSFDTVFDNMCANGNMTIMVIGSNGVVVRSSAPDMSTLRQEMLNTLWDMTNANTIQAGTGYQILSTRDTRLNSEYLVLVGNLDGGDMVLIRTALESIRESAMLSNRLLLMVGIMMIIISSIIGWICARQITRPILQLTDISRKMVGLDFDAKYVPGGWRKDSRLKKITWTADRLAEEDGEERISGNEIDLLGDHMNRLSENLEETISELKSANLELTRDIEKKEKIDEMRKEFLSNVSHELKTPLALIQGYAEGLEECINDDAESRDFYCDVIIDEASKMNRMVQKLLTLNQLEFGNDQVVMERFDVTELVNGVLNSARILMDKNEITLAIEQWPPVFVWGDEFKIEEVFTNYLSNAINHCEGEKIIRVTGQMRGELFRVCVYNTGKPIPEEDIGQIWDKFYKVDKARTREYGGSGIGLSIVKAVMDSHGMACGVENKDDGVEFWFELGTR